MARGAGTKRPSAHRHHRHRFAERRASTSAALAFEARLLTFKRPPSPCDEPAAILAGAGVLLRLGRPLAAVVLLEAAERFQLTTEHEAELDRLFEFALAKR